MFSGGAVNYDKKEHATSLLTLIKHQSFDLYNLICDLCLDGTFRSQRYQNTFLMPSDKLIKKIEHLVQSDKDVEAINAIRSLLLKGHLKKADFKKDARIGTLQFGSYVLTDPEEVAKHIETHGKSIIATKDGSHATIIFKYSGDDVPKTTEGKSGGFIPVGITIGGNDNDKQIFKDITQKLKHGDDPKIIVENFFKAVAAILSYLETEDASRYSRAKFYLAANPILSWFFLATPGRSDSLVKCSELNDLEWSAVLKPMDIIKQAERSDNYIPNKSLLKKIKLERCQLVSEDKASLVKMINGAYRKLLPEATKEKSIDDNLAKHPDLKILMDELRFMHDGSVSEKCLVEDAISDLGAIDWNNPQSHKVICDASMYENKVKGVEAFLSGPHTFIKSIYFIYIPLNDAIEEQLMNSMKGGSIIGGNPSTINNVVFTGGAARKQLHAADVKLSAFVKVLSKSQREALKAML